MTSSQNKPKQNWAILIYFIQLFVFYFVVFTLFRFIFIARLVYYFPALSFTQACSAFFYGFHLDVAMFCYMAVLPVIFYYLFCLFQKNIFSKWAKISTLFCTIVYSLVAMGDILLYKAWKTKLNMQAVLHFREPSEVFKTASWVDIFAFFMLIPLLIIGFSLLYNYFFTLNNTIKNTKQNTIAFLPIVLFIAIFFRGGVQELPISESNAYYSTVNEYNDASVNPLFSFINNASAYFLHSNENPFIFMTNKDAIKTVREYYTDTSQVPLENIVTSQKPNIVYIILESFSAQCSSYFGGLNFAPNMDSIAKSGIAFTHCYSSGNVSDQGIPAILSSFPASPSASLINQISKSKTLPCIANELKPLGYQTGFMYGGQLSFGNIKSYLMQKQFDYVKDENDLPTHFTKQALGINDNDMGGLLINELNTAKQPFMYGWFTLSTHNDFDIPTHKTHMANIENEYVNALHYTDSCLGLFFAKAKQQAWYNNTLFVLVSDHSHNTPLNTTAQQIDRYRIPLVLVGNILQEKWRGEKIDYTVSQLDITATILQQLQLKNSLAKFPWSKNLLTASKHFAPYSYFNGAGFIQDTNFCMYNLHNKSTVEASNVPVSDTNFYNTTKAFIQSAYGEYISR